MIFHQRCRSRWYNVKIPDWHQTKAFVYSSVSSLTSWCTNQHQNVHEDVHDVNIKIQSGENVLLGADRVLVLSSHHELNVIHEVDAEKESAEWSIDEGHCAAGKYDREDAEEEEDDDRDKQNAWRR